MNEARCEPDTSGILAPEMLAKRIVLVRATARLVAMIALLSSGFSIAQEDAAISPLRATTLSGVEVLVPDPERAAVLVVGFDRSAAPQVRLWRRYIDGIDSAPSVASVLVIDGMPRLVRGVLTRTIRGGVPEEREDSIYLVTEDGEAWRDLARIDEVDGADDAYVLRFDGKGRVCFRHVGGVTDAAASALLAADCDGIQRRSAARSNQRRTVLLETPACVAMALTFHCGPLGGLTRRAVLINSATRSISGGARWSRFALESRLASSASRWTTRLLPFAFPWDLDTL